MVEPSIHANHKVFFILRITHMINNATLFVGDWFPILCHGIERREFSQK